MDTLLTYIQFVGMDQFVLLEDYIFMKDVLRYAVVDPGVLSVIMAGIMLMLVFSVDS